MKKWYLAEFDAKNESYLRKLSETETRTIAAQKRIDGGNVKLKNSFATLTSGLGMAGGIAGVGLLLNKGFEAYKKLEVGMRNFNSIAKLNETQLKQTTIAVQQLSKKIGTPTSDLTGALYQAVSAGVAVGDSLAFTEIAAKTAAAGLTSAEVAVDGLTSVLNSFHKPASDAEKIADIMFQTVNLGKITFEELAASIAQVAPIAAASGIEFEQIAGAIATLTKQGVQAPEAITQIRAAIISMNDVLGDGWSKTMTLQEGMQRMRDMSNGSNKALKDLVGRIEGVNAILGLTGANLEMATQDLNAMKNASGEMGKAFSENTNTMQNKVDRLIASFEEMLISTVGNLEPAINGFIEFGTAGANAIGKIMNAFKAMQQDKELWEAFTAAFKITTNSFLFDIGKGSQVQLTPEQNEWIQKKNGTWKPDQGVVDKTGSFVNQLQPNYLIIDKQKQRNEENLKIVQKIFDTEEKIGLEVERLNAEKKKLIIGSDAYLQTEKRIGELQNKISSKTKTGIKEENKLREEAFQIYLENLTSIDDFSSVPTANGQKLGNKKTYQIGDQTIIKDDLPKFEMNPVQGVEQIDPFAKSIPVDQAAMMQIAEDFTNKFYEITGIANQFGNILNVAADSFVGKLISLINTLSETISLINNVSNTFGGSGLGGLLSAIGLIAAPFTGGASLALAAPALSNGGSFDVPAGFPNDSFPILVESGERVNVSTDSQTKNQEKFLSGIDQKLSVLNSNFVESTIRKKENSPIPIYGKLEGNDIYLSNKRAAKVKGRMS